MKKTIIRLTENDLHRLIEKTVKDMLSEEGEGGATSCGNVMQGGGSNPDAGQYVTPFGYDKETKKRSRDFKNGSMAIQTEKTDVLSRPIYKL